MSGGRCGCLTVCEALGTGDCVGVCGGPHTATMRAISQQLFYKTKVLIDRHVYEKKNSGTIIETVQDFDL